MITMVPVPGALRGSMPEVVRVPLVTISRMCTPSENSLAANVASMASPIWRRSSGSVIRNAFAECASRVR